jgi:4-hydroxybenzoate polyprenyltransferase
MADEQSIILEPPVELPYGDTALESTKRVERGIFLLNMVKLARPRTWFFIVMSYMIGWLLAGAVMSTNLFTGLVISLVGVVNVNLLNAYTDKEEDSVNLPHRVAMVDQVGDRNLITSIVALFGLSTLLALSMPFWYKVVYVVSVFDTVFYSLEPLRFKKRVVPSLVSFSGAVFLPAIGAWTLTNDLLSTPGIIYFLGYVFLTYCTLKNLPDYWGDKEAGLRTSATVFASPEDAARAAFALLLTPYPLLAGLTSFNVVEAKFGLLLVLLPLVVYIGRGITSADTYDKYERLHTLGLVYVVAFLVITLLIISPAVETALMISGLLAIQSFILKAKIDSR